MKFLDRALRLVRADAHGVMDQLEEESLLLKQHLREAELEITRKRVCLEALEEKERQLAQETSRRERQLERLDEDVELALAGDKQELARFAVKRLLPVRDSLRSLRERSSEVGQEREQLAMRLSEQQAQFEELRQQVAVRLATARRDRAEEAARSDAWPALDCADEAISGDRVGASDEEVELELMRRRSVAAQGSA